ncbi:MAG: hypothetical protein CMH56_17285 [Myxococcales bacterium]|nr:hypothetical protein [Myxococcales bacterium]|tara:strand:- start:1126 stop:2373 length:1248 start_codon:yes stop_codon:yes gene_type:complete
MATMVKRISAWFWFVTLSLSLAGPAVANTSGNLPGVEEGLWMRQRPEMPWVYMVLALPGDEFDYAEKLILADMLTAVVDEPRLAIRKLENLGGTIQSRATPEGIMVIVEGPSALAPLIVQALKTVFVPIRLSDDLVARTRNRVWRDQQKFRYTPKVIVEENTWRGWYAGQSPEGGSFVGHEALQQVTPIKVKQLHRKLLSRGGQRFFVEGRIHPDTIQPLLKKLHFESQVNGPLPTMPTPEAQNSAFPMGTSSVWAMPLWPVRQFTTPLRISFLRALEARFSTNTPLRAGTFLREKQSMLWLSVSPTVETKTNHMDALQEEMAGLLSDARFMQIWQNYFIEEKQHAERRFAQMGRAPVHAAMRWLQLDGSEELNSVPDAVFAMRLWFAPETLRLVYTPQKGQDPRIQQWLSASKK